MKEKKRLPNWNIAITHYLTAGFAVPFLASLIVVLPVSMILKNSILNSVIQLIVFPVALWGGVSYSANYINKKYFIENASEVAILSAIFMAVITGGYLVYEIRSAMENFNFISGLATFLYWIMLVAVFYFISKKHIINTPEQ